jgi:hypothetical protein
LWHRKKALGQECSWSSWKLNLAGTGKQMLGGHATHFDHDPCSCVDATNYGLAIN